MFAQYTLEAYKEGVSGKGTKVPTHEFKFKAPVFESADIFSTLEKTIAERKLANDDKSYVASLFREGINKIAQKVGEEAVETVIEAKDDNAELFLNESADLLFHYLILLQAKGYSLKDIETTLMARQK